MADMLKVILRNSPLAIWLLCLCYFQYHLCLHFFCMHTVTICCRNIIKMLIQKSSSVSGVVPLSAIDNLCHAGQELCGATIAGVSAGNREINDLLFVVSRSDH